MNLSGDSGTDATRFGPRLRAIIIINGIVAVKAAFGDNITTVMQCIGFVPAQNGEFSPCLSN